MNIPYVILKKNNLSQKDKKLYDIFRDEQRYWKTIHNISTLRKHEMLVVVQVYLLNMFFNNPIVASREHERKAFLKKDENKGTTHYTEHMYSMIRWYFEQELIPEELQQAIAKKQTWNRAWGWFKYDYIDLSKKSPKELQFYIKNDMESVMAHAIRKGNRKIVFLVVKQRPAMFNRLINYDQRHRQLDPIFDNKFLMKLRRMALLQPSAKKNGLHAPISIALQTPDFCKKYVSLAGNNISKILPSLLTEEICRIAVSQAGSALAHVPKKYQTDEVCTLAIQNSPTALKFIPAKKQKSGLVFKALLKYNGARKYIKKGAIGVSAK